MSIGENNPLRDLRSKCWRKRNAADSGMLSRRQLPRWRLSRSRQTNRNREIGSWKHGLGFRQELSTLNTIAAMHRPRIFR
jgi:hypothetical protein